MNKKTTALNIYELLGIKPSMTHEELLIFLFEPTYSRFENAFITASKEKKFALKILADKESRRIYDIANGFYQVMYIGESTINFETTSIFTVESEKIIKKTLYYKFKEVWGLYNSSFFIEFKPNFEVIHGEETLLVIDTEFNNEEWFYTFLTGQTLSFKAIHGELGGIAPYNKSDKNRPPNTPTAPTKTIAPDTPTAPTKTIAPDTPTAPTKTVAKFAKENNIDIQVVYRHISIGIKQGADFPLTEKISNVTYITSYGEIYLQQSLKGV